MQLRKDGFRRVEDIQYRYYARKRAPNTACSGQVRALPSLEGIQPHRVFSTLWVLSANSLNAMPMGLHEKNYYVNEWVAISNQLSDRIASPRRAGVTDPHTQPDRIF